MNPAYGSPNAAPVRPWCWGNGNRYSPDDVDCRDCRSQSSCFEQITRLRNGQTQAWRPNQQQQAFNATTTAPPTAGQWQSNYSQTQQAVQYAPAPLPPPQPQQTGGWQQPLYPRTQVPNPQPLQPAQRTSPHPVPPGYNLGWWADPLATVIVANPPPSRPQFEGEGLAARIAKNVALAMAETLLTQGVLVIRQMVLPPRGPKDDSSS